MHFIQETRLEVDAMDVILQADEDEVQDLVSQGLTKILNEEIEIDQPLKDKLKYACKALLCCEEEPNGNG